MTKETEKKSPLAREKRRISFDQDSEKFRAVTEEVDGQKIRKLKGYPILFNTLGKPSRGSVWKEKVDNKALDAVDFSKLVFLLDHQTAWALGKVGVNMTAVVDETGLFIDVTLRDTWLDDYVYDRVEAGILDGMSFWFDSRSIVATDWASKTDVILKINEVYEVSIVAFPAYEETVIITDEPDGEEPEEPEEPGNEDPIKQALVNLIEAY